MTTADTTPRPQPVTLVRQLGAGCGLDRISVTVELGAHEQEVVLVTLPRDRRLLDEIHRRLGKRLRAYRCTPESVTFALDDETRGGHITYIFDPRLTCARRRLDPLAAAC